MGSLTKFTIGIQARSTSTRLPGKVDRDLLGTTTIRRVLDVCFNSAFNINRYADTKRVLANVVMCIPYGDPIGQKYADEVDILEGPEDDVLTRYVSVAEKYSSDYIVRITADCPFHVPEIITKHITVARMNNYDYVSNVDERFRTAPDGHDCEVISRKLLLYINEHATDPSDREHVTTYIRRTPPIWAKAGFIINRLDQSNLKISLDTPEDEDRIRNEMQRVEDKHRKAEMIYGAKNVHRFS